MTAAGIIGVLSGGGDHPAGQTAAIILATLILEDPATAGAAFLAAAGTVGELHAWLTLVTGVLGGDLALYGCGVLIRRHVPLVRRLARRVNVERLPLHDIRGLAGLVFAARLVPGLRLPTYTGCGYFGVPFHRFVVVAAAASTLWTSALYWLIVVFGHYVWSHLTAWRWPIAIGVVCCFCAFSLAGQIRMRRRCHGPEP